MTSSYFLTFFDPFHPPSHFLVIRRIYCCYKILDPLQPGRHLWTTPCELDVIYERPRGLREREMESYWRYDRQSVVSIAGMGNVRPAGHIRPAKHFNVARELCLKFSNQLLLCLKHAKKSKKISALLLKKTLNYNYFGESRIQP